MGRPRTTVAVLWAARLALLSLALGAVAAAWRLGRDASAPSGQRFGCPMHPAVSAPAPGACPICGMALEAQRAPATMAARARRYGLHRVQRRLLRQAIDAPAWLEGPDRVAVLLYEDDLGAWAPGERAWFVPAASPGPGPGEAGRVPLRMLDAPFERWDDATRLGRLRREAGTPAGTALALGSAGHVTWAARPRAAVVVPSAAVIQSGDGARVLVWTAEHGFEPRAVRVGRTVAGWTTVRAGLRAGELVAGQDAFFLDADRRLQEARP